MILFQCDGVRVSPCLQLLMRTGRSIGGGRSLPAPQAGLLGPYGSPERMERSGCLHLEDVEQEGVHVAYFFDYFGGWFAEAVARFGFDA